MSALWPAFISKITKSFKHCTASNKELSGAIIKIFILPFISNMHCTLLLPTQDFKTSAALQKIM